jgi:hypothetical protein
VLIFAETPRGKASGNQSCTVLAVLRRSVKAARAGPGMSAATHRAAVRYAGVMVAVAGCEKTDPIDER